MCRSNVYLIFGYCCVVAIRFVRLAFFALVPVFWRCCGVLPRDFHGFCHCCDVFPQDSLGVPLESHPTRLPRAVRWSSFSSNMVVFLLLLLIFFVLGMGSLDWCTPSYRRLMPCPTSTRLGAADSLRSKIEGMEASVKAILTEEKVCCMAPTLTQNTILVLISLFTCVNSFNT